MAKLMVLTMFLSIVCVLWASTVSYAANTQTRLSIGDGKQWSFFGGAWTENTPDFPDQIRPPLVRNLHSRAFYKTAAYSDFTAEFEYYPSYQENGGGDAGLILRAKDPNHFYFVTLPWSGVQMRAKHYWAGVAKVSGDSYMRYLKLAWVPGVISASERWYKVKVEAKGPTITVWVDGRLAVTVTDTTYKTGLIGLAGYGWYGFRNVVITGTPKRAPKWDDKALIPKPAVELPVQSAMPSGGVTANGDVLMLCAGNQFLRSKDKGRTWEKPEPMPDKLIQNKPYCSNILQCLRNGRLIVWQFKSIEPPYPDPPKPQILISESTDNGYTWSDPKPSQVSDTGWPAMDPTSYPYGPQRPYGQLVECEDGSLVSLLIGTDYTKTQKRPSIYTWSAFHTYGAAIRSADGGASWSGPVEIDQPFSQGAKVNAAGALDFTEASGVAIGNTICVVIRPIYSVMMWQCTSFDSGKTWEPAVRTTFPGYAQAMVRTASGAILVCKRFPLLSMNISRDGGLNWDEGTVVDYPQWANGLMIEVEPDVVLCVYQNAELSQPLLAQRIRVLSDRIEPIVDGK